MGSGLDHIYNGSSSNAVQPSVKDSSNVKVSSKVDKESTKKELPHVEVICQHSFGSFVETCYMSLRLLYIIQRIPRLLSHTAILWIEMLDVAISESYSSSSAVALESLGCVEVKNVNANIILSTYREMVRQWQFQFSHYIHLSLNTGLQWLTHNALFLIN